MKTAPKSFMICTIALCAIITFGIGPSRADADDDDPLISVSLDSDHKEANVSPEDTGLVIFKATVDVYFPPGYGDVCRVDLKAWAHWEVSMNGSLNFSIGEGPKTIDVIVHVPINTSYDEEHMLSITGNYTFYPSGKGGVLEHVSALITVSEFRRVFMGCNRPVVSVRVGEWTHYDITITNRGNSPITIELHISSDNGHVSTRTPDGPIQLTKGETVNLTLRARQRPSRSGSSTVHVLAKDEGDGSTLFDLPLVLRTRPGLSTIMYEMSFIVLVSLLAMVSSIALALYLVERFGKGNGSEREKEDPTVGIDL
ncbi:MAG: hypothetical protein QCI82_10235 [Candidatus Thermoplasmatota archaeon]|nr:hypothetical protein [Candidatus Thermoplasmatota archaeon]